MGHCFDPNSRPAPPDGEREEKPSLPRRAILLSCSVFVLLLGEVAAAGRYSVVQKNLITALQVPGFLGDSSNKTCSSRCTWSTSEHFRPQRGRSVDRTKTGTGTKTGESILTVGPKADRRLANWKEIGSQMSSRIGSSIEFCVCFGTNW